MTIINAPDKKIFMCNIYACFGNFKIYNNFSNTNLGLNRCPQCEIRLE
jgi:hypothetical protein